jgi:hypothetical protein
VSEFACNSYSLLKEEEDVSSRFDPETRTVSVISAAGPSGVAGMLVALGNAGIEVERLVRRDDRRGEVMMRIKGNVELAARILGGIGCQVVAGQQLTAVGTAA